MTDQTPAFWRGVRAASLFFIVGFIGAVSAAGQRELPGVSDKWRHYRSPHFEVYSQGGERETRTLLRRLELVRAVFLQTFPIRERVPSEVTIYYFSNGRDFASYLPPSSGDLTIGVFKPFIDRDVMALSGAESSEVTLQVLQLHYVTHLFRLNGGKAPHWLTSGAGFLFSTLEPTQGKAALGKMDSYRAEILQERKNKFTSESLLRQTHFFSTDKERDVWQAHSCLFLHYLLLGSPMVPAERVGEFFRAVAEGDGKGFDAARARARYEKLLGVPFTELEIAIERYRRQGNFNPRRVEVPPLPEAESFTKRSVEAKEIRLRLADLALRLQRSAESRLALLQGTDSGDPRVFEALGMDAWIEGDQTRARERWQQAVEAGSDNPAVLHTLGLLETEQRFRYFDPYFRLSEEKAEQLRELFRRSIERTPSQSLAYERLAWVESAAPQPNIRNLNLVQSKFADLEQQSYALLALAHARLRLNDREGAAQLLQVAEESDDSAFMRNAVKALRRLMDRRPVPSGE